MSSFVPSEKFPTVESRITWIEHEIEVRGYWFEQTSNPIKVKQRRKYIESIKSELNHLNPKKPSDRV